MHKKNPRDAALRGLEVDATGAVDHQRRGNGWPTMTDLVSWMSLALVLLLGLLTSSVVFYVWRERRRERARRERQLESVYSARDHRERGD